MAEPTHNRYDAAGVPLATIHRLWMEKRWVAADLQHPYQVPVSEVWPYREYDWNETHHRSGAVPQDTEVSSWYDMGGIHYGQRRPEPTPEELQRWYGDRADKEYRTGNRFAALREYMRQHGWRSIDPAHLMFGHDGNAKLGEGNHRLAVARELGLPTIPVRFHFAEKVERTSEVARGPYRYKANPGRQYVKIQFQIEGQKPKWRWAIKLDKDKYLACDKEGQTIHEVGEYNRKEYIVGEALQEKPAHMSRQYGWLVVDGEEE